MNVGSWCALLLAGTLVEGVFAAIPLPEHPRPDWERADWINLNGEWEFGFEPGRYDRRITVPFGWGSPLSGVRDEGDLGHYRRRVQVPASWKGKRVFVVVGASDHDTTCTFAGQPLGRHSGGYTPFEYELTSFVKWGEEQILQFDVWDPPASLARTGHWLYGKQGYGNARGIWQTVYLEARGEQYLEAVRFYPDLARGEVTANALLAAPAKPGTRVKLLIDGRTDEIAVETGEMIVSKTVKLNEPRLWTLEDPWLYDVTAVLSAEGASADAVKTYFGFREIGTGKTPRGDTYMTLNGRPVYLQMTLDQSYHPEGWYTFPSDEFMKNEILLSKKLGLTGNRVHIKVEIPRKLYWADRLGLLIQADVPCAWGEVSEAMFDEHWKCFQDMVRRDFNHPSVYQWTLFNETWGLFDRNHVYPDWAQRQVARAYLKAKTADPTRLVEDNSACNGDHVITDVNSWHVYLPGYEWEKTVRETCETCHPGGGWNFIGGRVQDDAPMMNSECGNVWGYVGSTGDCDFTWDYHLMINAFRRHLQCAGWLYTEHHDVCNEWNGYVRYDRSPKYDGFDELAGMTLADLHREAALFFAGTPGREIGELLAPGQRMTVPVGVSFTTDRYAGAKLTLDTSFWYVDAEGVRQAGETESLVGEGRSWQCEKLWDVSVAAPLEPACGGVVFSLKAEGREIAKNFWSFGVTNDAPKTVSAVTAQWSEGTTNVLGGLKLNGFGKGFFEFELAAPAAGGVFRAELSSKRRNAKDRADGVKDDSDYMLGGGFSDRSKNPNSYPQTSNEKHPSTVKVFVGGQPVKTVTLADDPADHRGILSWLSQPHDRKLREAGSYGWLVEARVPASAVKGGKVTIRLEADAGLAVYGASFGRYPFGPHVSAAR